MSNLIQKLRAMRGNRVFSHQNEETVNAAADALEQAQTETDRLGAEVERQLSEILAKRLRIEALEGAINYVYMVSDDIVTSELVRRLEPIGFDPRDQYRKPQTAEDTGNG